MAENKPAEDNKNGVPMWMPLVGLIAAFLVAILIGATICPTLSALVMPPGPRLPSDVTERSHDSLTKGDDEWLYATNLGGCAVAKFYEDWLRDCTYAPNVTCRNGVQEAIIGEPGDSYHVVTCTGRQSIGNFSLAWTVYVNTGYTTGERTVFRLVREVSN